MNINHKEILRLYFLKYSQREIAQSLACSRFSITETLSRFRESGLLWDDLKEKTPDEVSQILFPGSSRELTYSLPDYAYVVKELSKPHTTLKNEWEKYVELSNLDGKHPYQYTQFKKYYYEYIRENKATMHLEHKRGETLQVDWAGTTLSVKNQYNGTLEKVYIFVATLPYSGYTYAEAFLSMKIDAWITGHVNAYKYFGGVTRILVPDNLKTGIIKNSKDEIIVNPTYLEMAEHYGTAVIPARVRSPKDKAAVEGTVGKITLSILSNMRNNQYFSLIEINENLWDALRNFNERPFQKKDGSRLTWFEEEKPFLLPLPPTPYEIATWKKGKVGYNYHVEVDKKYYSCPFEYIQKSVDIRISPKFVEIFYQGKRVTSHVRLFSDKEIYSTNFEHMPSDHQNFSKWNGDKFRKAAKKAGDNTVRVVDYFLTSPKVEQQGYIACLSLLKLVEHYSPEIVEETCRQILLQTHAPSLKGIKYLLENNMKKHTANPPSFGINRGPQYYMGESNDE